MEERRQYRRYPVILGSDIDAQETETMFGLTQDISRSGARLLTLMRYQEGNRLRLKIQLDRDDVTNLTAEVIRSASVAQRGMWQYEIGVRFDELLSEKLVTALRDLSEKLGW